jgi:hypothetical protein
MVLALDCAAHHGMALEPFNTFIIIKNKENTVKLLTPYSPTSIGVSTVFSKLVNAIHHFQRFTNFFLTLPIIWAQVAAKRLLQKSKMGALKIKKKYPAPQYPSKTCRLLIISTHLSFSLDNTFKS